MAENDLLVIYWAPAVSGWEMLYPNPQPLNSLLRSQISKNILSTETNMFVCPASNAVLQNTFVVKSAIDDTFDIPTDLLNELEEYRPQEKIDLPNSGNKVSVCTPRVSALKNYYDLEVNLHWAFFAEEPVTLKITSPFYPPSSPTEGAMIVAGELDIGKWFRILNLNYYVPKTSKRLTFAENDPLLYLTVDTTKKIVFKRYVITPALQSLLLECSDSPSRYGRFWPLSKRYEAGENSSLRERVLTEIKKSLVEV